jgi:hypothetical protein
MKSISNYTCAWPSSLEHCPLVPLAGETIIPKARAVEVEAQCFPSQKEVHFGREFRQFHRILFPRCQRRQFFPPLKVFRHTLLISADMPKDGPWGEGSLCNVDHIWRSKQLALREVQN